MTRKFLCYLLTMAVVMWLEQPGYAQITFTGPTFVASGAPFAFHGNWTVDPSTGKAYVFSNYAGSTNLVEYNSVANLISNTASNTYTLPTGWDGTGQVVYNGDVYYNQTNSRNMVKYNLATQQAVLNVPLANAGFQNTYPYSWGGYSDIDFAIDASGLWVIYATPASGGNIVISRLNAATLGVVQSWTTTRQKAGTLNAFIIDGVLYATHTVNFITSTAITYTYNTNNATGSTANIPFNTVVNGYNTALNYNPVNGVIYSWDNHNLYTYAVTICPTGFPVTGGGSYCADSGGVAIGLSNSETGVSYQLYQGTSPSGTPVGSAVAGSTGNAISFGTQQYPSGSYYVTATRGSCSVQMSGTVTVTANPLPADPANPTSNSPQCAGTGVTLTASGSAPGGQTWYWQGTNTAGTSTANNATATYNATTSGTYYIRARNNTTGCWSSGSGSVTVSVAPPPTTSFAGKDQIICIGNSASLFANNPSAGSGAWSISSGPNTATTQFNNTSNPTATFTPTAAGTYVLQWTISNPPCAPSSSTVTITVNPRYAITASAGTGGSISPNGVTNVCQGSGQTYTITPDPGYHIDDVLVDNTSIGAQGSYSFTNVTTTHTISATFAPNCVQPAVPTINASSTTNCGTQPTTLSIGSGSLGSATAWQWYSVSCGGTSAGSGSSITVSPGVTTTYYVRGEGGCVTPGSCGSVTINVQNNPPTGCGIAAVPSGTPYGGNPLELYLGYGAQTDTLKATATGSGLTYSWSPSGALSCTNCQSPVFAPTAGGSYTRTVTVSNGCAINCSVTICVKDMRAPGSSNVMLCHRQTANATAQTLAVNPSLAAQHLSQHPWDRLGSCSIPVTAGCAGAAAMRQVEELAADEVKVYPNPNNGSFTVELPFIEEGAVITVSDVQGRVVAKKGVNGDEGMKVPFKLNAAPGMYFVRVVNGEHRFQSKIMIQ